MVILFLGMTSPSLFRVNCCATPIGVTTIPGMSGNHDTGMGNIHPLNTSFLTDFVKKSLLPMVDLLFPLSTLK